MPNLTDQERELTDKLIFIARWLGASLVTTYGPKYSFTSSEQVSIYVDDYGHFMTVTLNGHNGYIKLASTHPNDTFVRPGNWQELILRFEPEAIATKALADAVALRKHNEAITSQLTPINL